MQCPCNNCPQVLEFEQSQAGETVQCPSCGLDTVLFIPVNLPAKHTAPTTEALPHPQEVIVPDQVLKEPTLRPHLDVMPPVQTARLRFARKTSLGGLALELVGFVLLVVFPIGTIIGLCLLIAGFNASKVWRCSNCMNFVADKKVRMCPSCGASIR